MPDLIRVQVTIPKTSAIPADAITNTFHFSWSAGNADSAAEAATDQLEVFYSAIRNRFGNDMNFGGARVKVYDMSDPEPRAPIKDAALGVTGSNTDDPLPNEVAICVSWEAEVTSGSVAARRRGRTFLGTVGRGTQKLGDRGRIDNDVVASIASAAGVFTLDTSAAKLQVYSPTDGLAHPVTGGWVDNSYDTVRSRGIEPTLRDIF